MADKDFVVKNGIVVNTSFSANSTQVTLSTINATSNGLFANTTVIKIGNSSVNATINTTSFTGDAASVGGNTAATLRSYTDTAYSNAISTTLSRNGNYTGNNTFSGANLIISGTNTSISSNVTITGSVITGTSTDISFRNATFAGNLVVSGTVVSVNTSQLVVNDNIIELGLNNTTTDTIDTGWFSPAGNASNIWYSGLARQAAKSTNNNPYFWLFGSNTNPNTSSTIDTSSNSVTGTLQAYLTPYGTGGAFIVNSSVILITANNTVTANITANNISGNGSGVTSVNAATVGGNTAATLRAYSDTAYSNAVSTASSDATSKAATAYSNAVSTASSDATNKAATAYINATSYAATIAGTAYSNALSDTLSRNGTYTGNNTLGGTNTVISSNVNITGTFINVASAFIANSTGAYHTGVVNGAQIQVGSSIVANSSRFVVGTAVGFQANGSIGTNGQVLISNGTTVYWGTGTSGSNTQIQFNDSGSANASAAFVFDKTTNSVTVSNTLTVGTATVNSTVYSGTANNSTNFGGSSVATVQGWITSNAAQAYSNAIAYSGNAALAYANAIAYSGNAALAYANAIAYSGNATLAYANAIAYSGNAALAYSNATSFASNATNISTGTLNASRLPYTMNQNLGTSNSPTFAGMILTGDIITYRSAAPTTGVIYLNSAQTRYLYFDGTNYNLPGGELYVNSVQVVKNSGTWNIDITGAAGSATSATTFTSTSQNSQFNSIGIGTAASGTAGEIRATNNITAYYSSDARLKTNVVAISDALLKVNQIRGVEFDWTDDFIEKAGGEDNYFMRKHDVGVIAQEIEKVLPEVVAERDDGMKAVKYDRIVALLIEAVKDLSKQIDELKGK